MQRFVLVLAVAALMAMMLVVMAAPAMAQTGSGGIVQIDPRFDLGEPAGTVTVVPPTFQTDSQTVTLPPNPILTPNPIDELNPIVV